MKSVTHEIKNQLRYQAWGQVKEVEYHARSQVESQVWSQIETQVCSQVRGQLDARSLL